MSDVSTTETSGEGVSDAPPSCQICGWSFFEADDIATEHEPATDCPIYGSCPTCGGQVQKFIHVQTNGVDTFREVWWWCSTCRERYDGPVVFAEVLEGHR